MDDVSNPKKKSRNNTDDTTEPDDLDPSTLRSSIDRLVQYTQTLYRHRKQFAPNHAGRKADRNNLPPEEKENES